MSEARLPRRRRSAARTLAILDPADIPEDAAGRIEVIVVRAPADVVDQGEHPPPPPPPDERSRLAESLLAYGGWPAVGALALIVVVIFLVGLALTR